MTMAAVVVTTMLMTSMIIMMTSMIIMMTSLKAAMMMIMMNCRCFLIRFEMLLRTKYACPVCVKSDYTEVQSSCVVCCNCCSFDPSAFASQPHQ